MSVPASRLLANVLRDELADTGEPIRLIAGTAGAATGTTGYANVVLAGVTYKVPRLAHLSEPAVGKVAYVLATSRFMIYVGTVAT